MSLPKFTKVGLKRELEFFTSATIEQRAEKAKQYGMSATSYDRRMRERGGHTGVKQHTVIEEPEVKYIPYPKFKIKPFKPAKKRRDEEDIAFVIADQHLGKITESYNEKIAESRMDYLLDSAMTIINLHRPIRKAHIFSLGDMVQGENVYQGSTVGSVEVEAYGQIYDRIVPLMSRFLTSLLQGVAEVDFYGVWGNHGKYAKEAPDKTNWDRFAYKAIADSLKNQKGIYVYPPKDFYQLVNIRGFRFFTIHGHQISMGNGTPLFGIRRKMQEWYAYVGGFNYAYLGHFHTSGGDAINSVSDFTMCPPLVTGDSWALEKVGRASEPRQLCFGVHSKFGRTFTYQLHTDDAFLTKKFDEPEGVINR